nr:growth arrest-specific protein 7-like [Danio rerio]|eukprot:XP_021335871.1 growth arrest-specific protein 7-like [Danio rerio]
MSGSFCRSLYAFTGEQHREGLSFQPGELILITQAPEGGWWEGEKDGARGWFPSTYVQMEQCVVDEPLPRHWRSYISPQGRQYYVNTISHETTWERPSSTPGTPKTPLKHTHSSGTGTPTHTFLFALVFLRFTCSKMKLGLLLSQFSFSSTNPGF